MTLTSWIIHILLLFNILSQETVYETMDYSCDSTFITNYFTYVESNIVKGNYDSALQMSTDASNCFKSLQHWQDYSRSLIKKSIINRHTGYYSYAKKFIKECDSIVIIHELKDSLLLGELLHEKVMLFIIDGCFDESLILLDSGFNLLSSQNQSRYLFNKYYNSYGMIYERVSNFDTAIQFYNLAISSRFIITDSNDYLIARYMNNVGIINLKIGDFENAYKYSYDAFKIFLSYGDTNSLLVVPILRTRGNIYYLSGKYDESLEYYFRSIDIITTQLDDSSFLLQELYNNIGNLFRKKGDLNKAIEYYEKSHKISIKYNAPNKFEIVDYYYKTGLIYFQEEQYLKSQIAFSRSLEFAKKYYSYYIPNVYHALASCYVELNKYDSAKYYYLKAVEDRIKYYGNNNIYLAYDYQNYGLFYLRNYDIDSGMLYIKKAIEMYNNFYGTKHPYISQLYRNIGDYYYYQSDYDISLNYYQKALIAIVDNFNDSISITNPHINDINRELLTLLPLREKARTLVKFYETIPDSFWYLELSFKTYELASSLIDKIRISYTDHESKIALTENEGDVYRDAMRVALLLYKITGEKKWFDKAFYLAERSKSAILSAAIYESEAKITSGLPSELIQKEKEVVQSIGAYQRMINEEKYKTNSDSIKLDLWSNKLFELKLERDRLIDNLEKNFPSYYEMKYRPYVTDITTLQQSLYENEALIEYVINDSSLFIFSITSGNIDIQITSVDSTFYQNLEYLLHTLYSKGILEEDNMTFGGFTDASFNLYNILMKPVTNLLTGKDLIIIPDERLSYLPFEVLLTSLPQNQEPYKNLQFLIKDHAIGYSYSATLLSDTRSRKRKQGKGLVAFAPSYPLNDYTSPFPDPKAYITRDSLINLPHVREEAEYISNLFGGELFLDNLATESGFKSMASKYKLIHLAMHGLMDEENPMFSKLVFAQSEDSLDDGYLYTYEIYNLNLNAQLAVLSACNTGAGRLVRGEGLMSMARGFYYAGCPGIITTRWSVNDKSSAEIMKRFYDYLAEGESKIEALRLAKLDYLSKSDPWLSHPRYWAAYVSVGEPGALEEKNNKCLFFIIPLIIVMLIVVTFFYRKRCRSFKLLIF